MNTSSNNDIYFSTLERNNSYAQIYTGVLTGKIWWGQRISTH